MPTTCIYKCHGHCLVCSWRCYEVCLLAVCLNVRHWSHLGPEFTEGGSKAQPRGLAQFKYNVIYVATTIVFCDVLCQIAWPTRKLQEGVP